MATQVETSKNTDLVGFLAAILSGDRFYKTFQFGPNHKVTFKTLTVEERDEIDKIEDKRLAAKATLVLSLAELKTPETNFVFPTLDEFPDVEDLVKNVYGDVIKSAPLENILWAKLDEFLKLVQTLEEEAVGSDFTQTTES